MPIGEVRKVSDTPSEECSDFRSFKRLGDVIPRCRGGDLNGYTMSFVINQNTASDKNGLKYCINAMQIPIKLHSCSIVFLIEGWAALSRIQKVR